MGTARKHIRDGVVTVFSLSAAFGISLLFQYIFAVHEHITTVFVFAVFLVSLLTEGYVFGIAAALLSTVAVNYAFTFPYFALNFAIPVNLISGIVMVVLAVLTSALTTKLKKQDAIKAESEKERMRANLLRAVSHDLRTPLTTIYGSATTLLENEQTMNEQQKTKMLNGIKEDAEWLNRMVENLLSVTRIDNGDVQIIRTPTMLEELIDAVILKFKKRYPAQKVQLTLPAEMVLIPMDAILIEQVLVNILENAVHHARGMSTLSLRVFTVGQKAIFEVQDNGCGIAAERLPTLFTGYTAAYKAVSDGGTRNAGIGLSVCASIIHAHGGEISAANGENGGAIFRFSLDTEEVQHER